MDKTLFRKRVRAVAARLGILRPLRALVFKIRGGTSANHEIDFLKRFIDSDSHVFDVGANRGQSSENYIAIGASVVAFEPQCDLHPEIRQLCRNSPRLTIEPLGLGSTEETRRFYITSYDQVASLREDWEGTRIGEKTIEVSTLDIQIAKHGLPDYCKIDVEGWELEVIRGLSKPIPILSFEYHSSSTEIVKAKAVLEQIAMLGPYTCNIRTSADNDFLLREFMPIQEFSTLFPEGLSPSPNTGYGDIFCALDPSRIRKA